MPKEYRDERLARVMREQIHASIEGVEKVVIVTNEGLILAVYPGTVDTQELPSANGSTDRVAALAAEIIAQSRRAFGDLAHGPVSRVLIEGESRSMIVVPAGDRASLAVLVDAETRLGIAMYQIARAADHIGSLLD